AAGSAAGQRRERRPEWRVEGRSDSRTDGRSDGRRAGSGESRGRTGEGDRARARGVSGSDEFGTGIFGGSNDSGGGRRPFRGE
ncbi:MAG: hypothetical protein ACKPHU_19425, partial [Planctomycetaceae bacterium]